MVTKYNFWDILAWVVLAGIVLWLVLKVTGVINTPILLEYAPFFGIVYVVGWTMHEIKDTSARVKNFDRFKDETIKEIHNLKLNCTKNHK